MIPSKPKTIKSMFSLGIFKNIGKAISKFFNDGIHRSEKSRGVRSGWWEWCICEGFYPVLVVMMMKMAMMMTVMTVMEVVLILTITEAIMVLMEGLIVLKVICMGWIWHQANIMMWDMTIVTYHNLRDLRVLVPVSLLIVGLITMMILCLIVIQCGNDYIMQLFMNMFGEIDYIMHVFWYVSTDDTCIYAFALYLVLYVICFGHVIYEYWCVHFFKICRDFFKNFWAFHVVLWAFHVVFCAYRLRSIRDAVTDPVSVPAELAAVTATLNHDWRWI